MCQFDLKTQCRITAWNLTWKWALRLSPQWQTTKQCCRWQNPMMSIIIKSVKTLTCLPWLFGIVITNNIFLCVFQKHQPRSQDKHCSKILMPIYTFDEVYFCCSNLNFGHSMINGTYCLPCFVLLVLLVAAAEILAGKAGTSIHLVSPHALSTNIPHWPACLYCACY